MFVKDNVSQKKLKVKNFRYFRYLNTAAYDVVNEETLIDVNYISK